MVKLKSAFRFVRPPPNHRPPPFRKPPPAASPSPAFTHEVEYNELQILCPQEVDSSTNYTRDDPQCAVPRGSVAVGDEAEAVRVSQYLYCLVAFNVKQGQLGAWNEMARTKRATDSSCFA